MEKCLRLALGKLQTTRMNIGLMSYASSDSTDFLGRKKGWDPEGILKQACVKQTSSYLRTQVEKPILYSKEENAKNIHCACACLDGTEKDRNATVVNCFREGV